MSAPPNDLNARGLGDMNEAELEAHVAELRARVEDAERRRADTRGLSAFHAGRVVVEATREIRRLSMQLSAVKYELWQRRARR